MMDKIKTISKIRLPRKIITLRRGPHLAKAVSLLKKAQEAAQTSQGYFEQLFTQAPDAIAACDANEYVLDVNPAFTDLFGYTPEEARGKHINDLVVPPDLVMGAVGIAQRVARGEQSYLEAMRRHKDGRLIPVAVTGAPVMIQQKRVGVYAIYRDITEQKKTEEALAKSEERYALAARGASDGLWDWDIVQDKEYFSPRFKELLGYRDFDITNEELQRKFPTLLAPGYHSKMETVIQDHLTKRVPYDFEYEIILNSGEKRWFRSRAQAVWDEKTGQPLRMAGSIRDITPRRQAEAALAASKKLLHDVLQGSPVAMYVIDKDHKVVIWNKAMEHLTGRHASEMIGTDKHWQVFYPVKRPMIADYMVEGKSTLQIIKDHYRHTNFRESRFENGVLGDVFFPAFHGGGKWLRFMIKPLYDFEGNRIGAIEMVEDIHHQKMAEQTLQARMNELKVLYQVNTHTLMARPLPHVLRDVAKDLTLTLRFTKLARVRIVFDGVEYTSSPKKQYFIAKMQEPLIVRGEKRGKIELGYIRRLSEMNVNPFLPEDRSLLKDVTRTVARHVSSRETFERYAKLLKKMNTGVFIVESDIFRYANPKLCKILKVKKEEDLLGRSCHDFVLDCRLKPGQTRVEAKARRQDGKIIDIEIMVQTIDYHGHKGRLGTLQDITTLKRAQEQLNHFNDELKVKIAEKTRHLEEANKRLQSLNALKDEFIAVTSHELRSPLTAARGYLSFLNDPEVLKTMPDTSRQYLARAHGNVESLNNLVNNILDVSRLESGRFTLRTVQANLPSLIKTILDNLAINAREKKLTVYFKNQAGSRSLLVPLDTIRIHQVMVNLLDNAIKYSNPGKTIQVLLAVKKSWVEIQVKDQGIGIPQKEVPKIFEKFMQAQNAAARYKGGAGLGLFITQKIVELHGGTISVKSALKKGTTFIVRLPLNSVS